MLAHVGHLRTVGTLLVMVTAAALAAATAALAAATAAQAPAPPPATAALVAATAAQAAAPPSSAPASPAPASSPSVIDQVSVVIVQLRDPAGGTLSTDQLHGAEAVIEARLAVLPGPGTTVTTIPGDRIRIDLADPSQLDVAGRVSTAPGSFRIVGIPSDRAADVQTDAPLPADMDVHEIVAPGHIERASVTEDQLGNPVVDLEMDDEAAAAFDTWAAEHMGETVALVLDDTVMSAPTLRASRFNGQVQVSGALDLPRAQELAAILSGGPLPVLAETLPDCLPAACAIEGASRGADPSAMPSVPPAATTAP
jgi:hypothetical protein